MDSDFNKINYFIYDKINKYNERFDLFNKQLDVYDKKVKKECKKSINDTIKKHPKKTAKKIIELTQQVDNDETDNSYSIESNDEKHMKMKGGNIDLLSEDDDFTSEVEILEEEPIIYSGTYIHVLIGINIFIIFYFLSYIILTSFNIYLNDIVIYYPLIEFHKVFYNYYNKTNAK